MVGWLVGWFTGVPELVFFFFPGLVLFTIPFFPPLSFYTVLLLSDSFIIDKFVYTYKYIGVGPLYFLAQNSG